MFSKIFKHNQNDNITEQEFLALDPNKVIVVDVRNNFELGGGYLESAINIPFQDIIEAKHHLPKDKIIATYCNYGNRAGKAAEILRDSGYEAYNLGGYALFSKEFIEKYRV